MVHMANLLSLTSSRGLFTIVRAPVVVRVKFDADEKSLDVAAAAVIKPNASIRQLLRESITSKYCKADCTYHHNNYAQDMSHNYQV